MTNHYDTISAITTPLGTGGVGVIRISGDNALGVIDAIFDGADKLKPNMAKHGWLKDPDADGELVDEVLVLYFKAPYSYTGEDVIEISCHGGMNIVRNVLNLTLKNGARMAQRGEFTKRAFLNGKMDLSQAEAVLDVIHSKTDKFSKVSAHNLSGTLSDYIKTLRSDIMEVLAKVTAAIDFPDDVLEPEYSFLEENLANFIKRIEAALSTANSSNLMRQGLKVAIIGQTNVGKSSLFNALLNTQRAIVTNIAGTTRDVIAESLDVGGIPVTLMDTAGLRELEEGSDSDYIEAIGIDISKKCIEDADLVLFVYDLIKGMSDEDEKIYAEIQHKPHITLASKVDIAADIPEDVLCISAVSGFGIDDLKSEIEKKVVEQNMLEDSEFSTNLRQQECLSLAKDSLGHAMTGVIAQELQDLISIDIKTALLHLDEITGEVMTDEILTHIFEQFCIGK